MAVLYFQGKPLHTCGELPAIGTVAPNFRLVDGRLNEVGLSDYAEKIKVLNIVPSLDTPVCAASARMFNQKAARFENAVVLLVSADLPFAQCRFCTTEDLKQVLPLSSFRSDFGQTYGVTLTDSLLAGLLARAVVVIDGQNRVVYTELVQELTHEPDYDAVSKILSG